jgi:hypothetical protein
MNIWFLTLAMESAQRYNWRYKKTGHVFQGRYKAIIVDKDSYLLEPCRYVVLNPIRAYRGEKPEAWKWSSYGATAGVAEAGSFLTTDWLLSVQRKEKESPGALPTICPARHRWYVPMDRSKRADLLG